MKQKKSTGALVVSLLLAAVLIGVYLGVAIKLGTTIYKDANGETIVETPQPDPEGSIAIEDELPAEPAEDLSSQEVTEQYPYEIEFEKEIVDGDHMRAVITAHFENGRVWTYGTKGYPMTELDPVDELYAWEDTYVFCAGGEIIAMDTAAGMVKWTNSDFGGYCPVYLIDENRTMYLSGFYGPDLHVVDADGNTLAHVEKMDAEYMWPVEVEKTGENKVTVIFAMGPEGEGSYPLDYDLVTGQITKPFVPDVPVQNLAWMDAYRTFMEKEDGNYLRGYALIYLDGDDIPELCAQGEEMSTLVIYDAETDSVESVTYEGDEVCYYAGVGVFSINSYKEDESEETFYIYRDGAMERVGTAKMHHYEEKEPDCWWDGKEMSVNDFYKKLNSFRPTDIRSDYARTYPKQMLLEQMNCWNNPSENIYWNWKEDYIETIRHNMDRGGAYALVDVDENGVPELFVRFEESNGEVYTQMQTFNPQTHQNTYCGFSGSNTAYIPGTGIVTDTYIYNDEYYSDCIYQVTDRNIREIAYGDRQKHADGGMTCYLNGTQMSEAAYKMEMAALFDKNAVRIADLLVSAEEIMPQLR